MTEMTQDHKKSGKVFLVSILAFFATFATVDAFFVFKALSTHSGVVDEKPYETGLAFNQKLRVAKEQEASEIYSHASYEGSTLTFKLLDKNNAPVNGAVIAAKLIRPTHDGYDFETVLPYKGQGLYELKPDLPLKGLWLAQIEAQWQDHNKTQTYQTQLEFIHP